jgi:basic membrane protein A
MKKGLMSLAVMGLAVLAMSGCTKTTSTAASTSASASTAAVTLKAGLINVGDEQETYSKAHIDGFKAAAKKLGIPDANLIIKNKIGETDAVTTNCDEIVSNGASIVFTNSYGHQDYTYAAAKKYPNVTFVADTGDYAAISGLTNYKNAFTNIYEARYVSGLVGGMKLKELKDANKIPSTNLDAAGNVKIGYVGAYKYAEVISGMTSFYQGVKAGFGSDKVAMSVQFTSSWYDHDAEGQAATALVNAGCVLIGQHADSTGAPEAVETLLNAGKVCYSVGYNIDMLSAAPHAALTSATNNWEKYYEYALSQKIAGADVATDWAKGYNDDAVAITTLGPGVASGTQAAVDTAIAGIKAGTLHIFDTSKFTVSAENIAKTKAANGDTIVTDTTGHVTSDKVDFSYYDWSTGTPVQVHKGDTLETVKTSGTTSYIEESVVRSAPYFGAIIDGVTWLN